MSINRGKKFKMTNKEREKKLRDIEDSTEKIFWDTKKIDEINIKYLKDE